MAVKRPRVAAIGLEDAQFESIQRLCGTLRWAVNWDDYLCDFAATETDVVVASYFDENLFNDEAHLMVAGEVFLSWVRTDLSNPDVEHKRRLATCDTRLELEAKVTKECPPIYEPLADALVKQITDSGAPPLTIDMPWEHLSEVEVLVETTSHHPVALRCEIPSRWLHLADIGPTVLLALPPVDNLVRWFHAFMDDVRSVDPNAVPQPILRLIDPSDWHSPEERSTARRIDEIDGRMDELRRQRAALALLLIHEGQRADAGPRRAILDDGDDLVEAVHVMLSALGFDVVNVDDVTPEGQAKKDDLRLTLPGRSGWEAIVEIKGYKRGIRTNDADQVRRHREQYILDHGRAPDLTVWITNAHKSIDPSARPLPDTNVDDKAKIAGAAHVSTTDLYRVWSLVASGLLEAEDVVNDLCAAKPCIWSPSALGCGTL